MKHRIFFWLFVIPITCFSAFMLFCMMVNLTGWPKLAVLGSLFLVPFLMIFCWFFYEKFKVEIGILGNVIREAWLLWIWPAFLTASVFIFFFVNIVLGWVFGDGFLAPMVISYWNITSEGFIVFWRIMCVLTSILYLELFWIGITVFFIDKVDWD